ncbi:IS110 family transposase [Sutcliffiella cohnii]|uniref:IS110 family transposase n=1 Tax=Sutcliffiella cohnii TaxID=33932 RepID=A0A223KT32_9BACI|nr:IS110 family transposase [Sutcliffiella cohnii]AST90630.1 IS110 family transposase [Sutcliffiella cohnii]AST92630.1 IS110 family transposase [Sutcliffiella cohnii]
MRLLNGKQGLRRSQFAKELRGADLEKVLIVSIDVSKVLQKSMILNYFGEVIQTPFSFMVSQGGFRYLFDKIETAQKFCQAEKVFVGIEATGHYYEDIVRILTDAGYSVHIINPASTHEERKQHLTYTKTDDIDLYLIAEALIGNKATNAKLPTGHYKQLQHLTRARRNEVNKRSRIKVEIRAIHDHIWREYQGYSVLVDGKVKTKNIFSDFWGKASLHLLVNFPHASQLLELGELGLRKLSKEYNLKLRNTTIEKLLFAASESVSKPIEELSSELFILKQKLKDYQWHTENIKAYEQEIERIFIDTDGLLLLTVPGIGLVTAAEVYCEMGDLSHYTSASQLIKKAGTNPTIKQSGPEKGYYGQISKQGNANLRRAVFNAGKTLSTHNEALRPFYKRLKENGKKTRQAYIAMGNKFLKIAFAMLKNQQPFQWNNPTYNYKEEVIKKLTLPIAA